MPGSTEKSSRPAAAYGPRLGSAGATSVTSFCLIFGCCLSTGVKDVKESGAVDFSCARKHFQVWRVVHSAQEAGGKGGWTVHWPVVITAFPCIFSMTCLGAAYLCNLGLVSQQSEGVWDSDCCGTGGGRRTRLWLVFLGQQSPLVVFLSATVYKLFRLDRAVGVR